MSFSQIRSSNVRKTNKKLVYIISIPFYLFKVVGVGWECGSIGRVLAYRIHRILGMIPQHHIKPDMFVGTSNASIQVE